MKYALLGLGVVILILLGWLIFRQHNRDLVKRVGVSMVEMKRISIALELYAAEHNGKYPISPEPGTKASKFYPGVADWLVPKAWPVPRNRQTSWLTKYLTPKYIKQVPLVDGWGHPILCDVSQNGADYTIVSLGRDGKYDTKFSGYDWPSEDFDDDLIYKGGVDFKDGQFISAPEGSTH